MRRILTCSEMKEMDRRTIEDHRVPSCVLMERAALSLCEEIIKHMDPEKDSCLALCGSGNNGGDGIAAARILHLKGYRAAVYMAGSPEHMTEECRRQLEIAEGFGVPVLAEPEIEAYTVLIDALFGVGLSRPVEGKYRDLVERINRQEAFTVACDIPSGVCGDTGRVLGCAVKADLTVTFACEKRGQLLYPGRELCGTLLHREIGIPIAPSPEGGEGCFATEPSDLRVLASRRPEGNKGTFGKVLCVTGSPGMAGAAYFTAAAALRTGCGMVKVQTAEENRLPLQTLCPEAIVDTEQTEEAFSRDLDWCDVLVLGPGLGTGGEAAERAGWFLNRAAQKGLPVVLDADGLNLLAAHPEWKTYLGPRVIVTPHVGEMSRLTGKSIRELKEDLPEAARALALENHVTCVLKDAATVTASPEGGVWINTSGNDGMAGAGSGDVLSGVLGGLLAVNRGFAEKADEKSCALWPEGLQSFAGRMAFLAALGVYLHGFAGDLAAEEEGRWGMTARSILSKLPEAAGRLLPE